MRGIASSSAQPTTTRRHMISSARIGILPDNKLSNRGFPIDPNQTIQLRIGQLGYGAVG